ncbi:MAG: hypothetical protein ACI9IP_002301 [Arcticibacterium sp.]|jgi:hypothetical protein
MENRNVSKSGIAAVLLGGAFLVAAAAGIYQYQNAGELKQDMSDVVVQNEALETRQIEVQEEMTSIEADLSRKIAEAEASAKELEELKSASKKSGVYSFKAKKRRQELENELALKNDEIGNLQGQMNKLSEANLGLKNNLEVVPVLEAENEVLKSEIALWEQKYAVLEEDFMKLNTRYQKLIYDAPADNFKVEILGNKDRLTSKARKAERIRVSFLMPAYLQKVQAGNETLYLSLFDEKIEPLEGVIKEVNLSSEKGSIPVAVHAMIDVDYSKNPQVVSFTVNTDEKLSEGSYKGKVYSKDDYLGTVDFRLR